MKKDELLGIEVYYEDNPEQCEPRGHEGVEGVRGIPAPKPGVPGGVWVFGDSDEEDDFNDIYEDSSDYDCDYEEDFAVVPVKGRIYRVRGLNIVARLKEIRALTKNAGIFEMDRHGGKFYIDPSDLKRASQEEVEDYLEENN